MAAALCAAAAIAAAAGDGDIRGSPTYRPEVVGRVGVVAAGRHFAAEAGMRMLARGGNAIDAGVAATFAAAVTEISHFGLGGEVPLILYLADQKQAIVVNGQGVAPAAASAEHFRREGSIPTNGPSADGARRRRCALALRWRSTGR
jgi:gamma-glutamyltranspeptidase/glutathione hydrolase